MLTTTPRSSSIISYMNNLYCYVDMIGYPTYYLELFKSWNITILIWKLTQTKCPCIWLFQTIKGYNRSFMTFVNVQDIQLMIPSKKIQNCFPPSLFQNKNQYISYHGENPKDLPKEWTINPTEVGFNKPKYKPRTSMDNKHSPVVSSNIEKLNHCAFDSGDIE